MASVTIRDIPEVTYQALQALAAAHGRGIEAEILAILENAVRPDDRIKLGSLLAEIGREVGGIDLETERSGIHAGQSQALDEDQVKARIKAKLRSMDDASKE